MDRPPGGLVRADAPVADDAWWMDYRRRQGYCPNGCGPFRWESPTRAFCRRCGCRHQKDKPAPEAN
jgi:hypothetical protein